MKTQILSIAGVDYSSLSAKVRLHFCREMGIMVLNKKRKKEEIMELEDDPDDVDKHKAEKHFWTTVNFLCQKYEKMKKQVGYGSE